MLHVEPKSVIGTVNSKIGMFEASVAQVGHTIHVDYTVKDCRERVEFVECNKLYAVFKLLKI